MGCPVYVDYEDINWLGTNTATLTARPGVIHASSLSVTDTVVFTPTPRILVDVEADLEAESSLGPDPERVAEVRALLIALSTVWPDLRIVIDIAAVMAAISTLDGTLKISVTAIRADMAARSSCSGALRVYPGVKATMHARATLVQPKLVGVGVAATMRASASTRFDARKVIEGYAGLWGCKSGQFPMCPPWYGNCPGGSADLIELETIALSSVTLEYVNGNFIIEGSELPNRPIGYDYDGLSFGVTIQETNYSLKVVEQVDEQTLLLKSYEALQQNALISLLAANAPQTEAKLGLTGYRNMCASARFFSNSSSAVDPYGRQIGTDVKIIRNVTGPKTDPTKSGNAQTMVMTASFPHPSGSADLSRYRVGIRARIASGRGAYMYGNVKVIHYPKTGNPDIPTDPNDDNGTDPAQFQMLPLTTRSPNVTGRSKDLTTSWRLTGYLTFPGGPLTEIILPQTVTHPEYRKAFRAVPTLKPPSTLFNPEWIWRYATQPAGSKEPCNCQFIHLCFFTVSVGEWKVGEERAVMLLTVDPFFGLLYPQYVPDNLYRQVVVKNVAYDIPATQMMRDRNLEGAYPCGYGRPPQWYEMGQVGVLLEDCGPSYWLINAECNSM